MNFLIASPKLFEPNTKTMNKLTHLCLAPEFHLSDQVSTKKFNSIYVYFHIIILTWTTIRTICLVHKYISTEGISTTMQCLAPLCKPPGPQFPAAQTCFG